MKASQEHKPAGPEILGLLIVAAATMSMTYYFKDLPGVNVAPMGFTVLVLLAGFAYGPQVAWAMGLVLGFVIMGLFFINAVSIQACLASLAGLLVGTLFPLPWTQMQEEAKQAFDEKCHPLQLKRDFAAEQLAKISKDVQISEQRGRETDALYHAGREISKLLSLQDTLEFSREIIRDTLLGSGGAKDKAAAPTAPAEPSFVLMLVDEDAGRFRLGTYAGLEEAQARRFETALGGLDIMNWLRSQGKALIISNTASEARLKGMTLPPQLRGLSSVPLFIQDQVIGLVVVFDFGGAKLDRQDSGDVWI
jgi:hypothetical protein